MKTIITTSIIGLTLAAMTASAAIAPKGNLTFKNNTPIRFDISMADDPQVPAAPIKPGDTIKVPNSVISYACSLYSKAKDCKIGFINHSSGKEVGRLAIDTTGTAPYHVINATPETTKYKVNYDNPLTQITINKN